MKNLLYLFFALLLTSFSSVENTDISISLPLGGNAFSSKHIDGSNTITDKGIENWTDSSEYFTAYFRISKPGTFKITIEDSVEVYGKSELEF